jgi:hypothetical protein
MFFTIFLIYPKELFPELKTCVLSSLKYRLAPLPGIRKLKVSIATALLDQRVSVRQPVRLCVSFKSLKAVRDMGQLLASTFHTIYIATYIHT